MLTNQKVETSFDRERDMVKEFFQQLQLNSKSTITNYENVLIDFYLFYGKEWRELSIGDYQSYLDFLERVHKYKGISQSNLAKKVKIITRYLTFLHNKNLIDFEPVSLFKDCLGSTISDKKLTKKERGKKTNELNKLPEILNEYILFLNNKEYSSPRTYKKRIIMFQRFIERNGESINIFLRENMEKYLFNQIANYEKELSSRVAREEIALTTATSYLRTVQLFVKFLSSKNLINKKYIIPLQLRGRGNRSNEYVPKERIEELMDGIYEHSNHVLRDLSIFLIILDTGCRPIEVSNLTLDDVDNIEGTLSLHCVKTERRKIKLDIKVMNVVKDYLSIRDEYNPKTHSLFVNCSGNPITSSYINVIYYELNCKVFGEMLYSAKAFRHTYITNALEKNKFNKVSESIGHKDLKSTYYYYHRSKKRLLANTLNLL